MAVRSFIKTLIDAQVPSMFSTDAPHISFPASLNADELLYLSQQIEAVGGRDKWILASLLNSEGESAGKVVESDGSDGVVWGNKTTNTYSRSATVVVAASDSLDTDGADYVCDGVDDEVQINLAILDAYRSFEGGRVVLLDGTFELGDSITILSGVILEGQGSGTHIDLPDSWSGATNMIYSQNDTWRFKLKNLHINAKNKTGGTIYGIKLEGSGYWEVTGCIFSNFSQDACINLSGNRSSIVSNNVARGCDGAKFIFGGGIFMTICNNTSFQTTDPFSLTSLGDSVVIGNTVYDNNEEAFLLTSCYSTVFANNMINSETMTTGFDMEGCYDCVITGSIIKNGLQYGILAYSGHDNIITNNMIFDGGQQTDDTYDGIRIQGDNQDFVSGNMIRHGGGATQFRYGINVSGGSGNTVINNDLLNSGRTQAMVDNGTDTSPGNLSGERANVGIGLLISGDYASASGKEARAMHFCQRSLSSGKFSFSGDAQMQEFVWRNQTTDDTLTELFLDGSSIQAILPVGTTWVFSILINGHRTDAVESAGYKIEGVISRDASNNTAIVGSPVVTVLAEDDAAWDVGVLADDTTEALSVGVLGAVGKDINWVAYGHMVQVSYDPT